METGPESGPVPEDVEALPPADRPDAYLAVLRGLQDRLDLPTA